MATASNSDETYQEVTTLSQPLYQEVITSNSAHENQAALSVADDIAEGNESDEEEEEEGGGGGGGGGGGEGGGNAIIYEEPTECGNESFSMDQNDSYSTIPTDKKM